MPELVVDRRRPGRGFKHLVGKGEVRRFVESLPNWNQLREGLNAIVLDSGRQNCMGWHRSGVVAICAWEREIQWESCYRDFHESHSAIFAKLDVPVEKKGEQIRVIFTEATARAFQLIHILIHELGHHHDRMTTRSRRQPCRGETYAEAYARRHEEQVITIYRQQFGI
ncbi:hypothetical protein [Planctomicrobium piriforme]|nr:hypothetical protein [Planctomicrobium piriforme]